jgi:hypothetical protein
MTQGGLRVLAWTLWAVGLAMPLTAFALGEHPRTVADVSTAIAFTAIGTVGLVVVLRSNARTIGWLYLGTFLGSWLGVLSQAWAQWALTHDAPGAELANWIGGWFWTWVFGLVLFSLLLFPDGHLPSPRWRWVGWSAAFVVAVYTLSFAFTGQDYTDVHGRHTQNPFSTPTLERIADVGRNVGALLFIVLVAVAVGSLVVRFRHGDEVRRAQVKWLIPAGCALVVFLALPFDHGSGGWVDILLGVVLAGLPVSVGVAITRYHLYDIDRIISRSASYALVTGAVVALYALVVTAVPRVVPVSSSLSVAVATLAAAAAFRPLLRHVRSAVDRRFDRAQYDAHRTVESFGARLRDEVDPGLVIEDLLGTVRTTMQPTRVRLSLRGGEGT